MNRRGHVYPEIWFSLAVTLFFLAISVPLLERGQWVRGGLLLIPVLLIVGWVVRGWWERRKER